MDRLARFTVSHSRFTILMIVAVVAAGTAAFLALPRQEDPEITLRSAQVVTRAPGLSPERVEQLITRPIEDSIKRISEVDEIESVSMTGTSIVTAKVAPRFDDMLPIWAKLRDEMEDLRPQLPAEISGPFVNDDYGRIAVVTLALTGRDFTMAELGDVARDLRDELGALPLVSRVDLYGEQEERIWLEFDPRFLAQFDLDPAEVVRFLQGQNIVLPGGTIDAAGQSIVIEPSGDFRSIAEIENLAISTRDGALLYLQDIARVRRDFVDPPEAPAFFNGEPAVVLGVAMVSGSNVVAVGRQVAARLAELEPALPLGMSLDVAIFQPDLIRSSVRNASVNLLQTMTVVLVVVMLFLGWRMGLIVGAMVPMTMMVTLAAMWTGEIALHRVSIAAVIVALGLLVDNGVVIAEDIHRRIEAGARRFDAALATPRSLAVPLLTSSLTTVLAFLPLMLISDSTGEFLRSLGQVLAIALLTSWVLSISITPALCYWLLPHRSGGGEVDRRCLRTPRLPCSTARDPGGRSSAHRMRSSSCWSSPCLARLDLGLLLREGARTRSLGAQSVHRLRRPARRIARSRDDRRHRSPLGLPRRWSAQPRGDGRAGLRGVGWTALLPGPLAQRPAAQQGLPDRQHRARGPGPRADATHRGVHPARAARGDGSRRDPLPRSRGPRARSSCGSTARTSTRFARLSARGRGRLPRGAGHASRSATTGRTRSSRCWSRSTRSGPAGRGSRARTWPTRSPRSSTASPSPTTGSATA